MSSSAGLRALASAACTLEVQKLHRALRATLEEVCERFGRRQVRAGQRRPVKRRDELRVQAEYFLREGGVSAPLPEPSSAVAEGDAKSASSEAVSSSQPPRLPFRSDPIRSVLSACLTRRASRAAVCRHASVRRGAHCVHPFAQQSAERARRATVVPCRVPGGSWWRRAYRRTRRCRPASCSPRKCTAVGGIAWQSWRAEAPHFGRRAQCSSSGRPSRCKRGLQRARQQRPRFLRPTRSSLTRSASSSR
jgi:hypothetical protein